MYGTNGEKSKGGKSKVIKKNSFFVYLKCHNLNCNITILIVNYNFHFPSNTTVATWNESLGTMSGEISPFCPYAEIRRFEFFKFCPFTGIGRRIMPVRGNKSIYRTHYSSSQNIDK